MVFYVMLCYVILFHVTLFYVILCYLMLCHVILCYFISCYFMLFLADRLTRPFMDVLGSNRVQQKLRNSGKDYSNKVEFRLNYSSEDFYFFKYTLEQQQPFKNFALKNIPLNLKHKTIKRFLACHIIKVCIPYTVIRRYVHRYVQIHTDIHACVYT